MSSSTSQFDPGIGFSVPTLPMEGVRSQVYSDKRATASLKLDLTVDVRASHGKAQFASAVAAVLALYHGSELVAFGICQKSAAIAVSLSTPTSGTLDTLALQTANVIDNTVWDPASFEHRVIDAGLSAVVNRNPLFASLVALDDRPVPSLRQDLSLCLEDEQTLVADYNARLFRPEIVGRFLAHVQRMLVAFQQTPSSSMSDIRIIGEEENAGLLAFASGGPPAFDGTITELLFVALGRQPHYPAVEFEGRCWNLEQLVERADKIAAMLVPQHVRKGHASVSLCDLELIRLLPCWRSSV